jgi:phosphoadenosine phosphosulfate reductase
VDVVEWTDPMVKDYLEERGVMVHPLRSDGYSSIGCAPCTGRAVDDSDPQSGRWWGCGKTECGIPLP